MSERRRIGSKTRRDSVPKLPDGLGDPGFFGTSFRNVRNNLEIGQPESGKPLNMDGAMVSRLEHGQSGVLDRAWLAFWGHALDIPDDIMDGLMVDAGYIPAIGEPLTRADRFILTNAIRELIGREKPTGFIEMTLKRFSRANPIENPKRD